MGLVDKFKKILFDEDVIEVPVSNDELPEKTKKAKKEDKNTGFIDYHNDEVEEDTIKEIKVPAYDEKEEMEVEEAPKTFSFPQDIDYGENAPTRLRNYADLDLSFFEEEKEEVKTEVVSNYQANKEPLKQEREVRDYRKILSNDANVPTKKPFTNTPVISPVWGILDKNYKPEEIVDRTETLTKVNTGAMPRSYGPVSYNDEPIPQKRVKEEASLKEDLVELNTTISDLISEKSSGTQEKASEDIVAGIEDLVNEDISPTHSLESVSEEVIRTTDYDDYDSIDSRYQNACIESPENANNNIEDAFESTSELNSINERDTQEEDEPMVDLETLIDKNDDEDPDDVGLDNTIETDLFNLIDSMYKDKEEE